MQIPQEEWLLRLYVSGRGWLTSRTETNLERLCRQYLKSRYRIVVGDLSDTRRALLAFT